MPFISIFRLERTRLIITLHTVQGYDMLSYPEKDRVITRKTQSALHKEKGGKTYRTRDIFSIRKRRLIPFYPATGRNELCRRSPEDSAFSMAVPPPSAASQGRHRRALHPAVIGKRSRILCLSGTSTSSSGHETIQFSDSSRALVKKMTKVY